MNWIQAKHNPNYYGYHWGDYNCHINTEMLYGPVLAEIYIGGSVLAWDSEERYPPQESVLTKIFNSLEEAQEAVRARLIERCVYQQRFYRKFENELAD